MVYPIDFRPSAQLSHRFARDSWSVWYASMFTVPNTQGGVGVLDRPALQVFASLMPFAVRRLVSPEDERVQSIVADRFQRWLFDHCSACIALDGDRGVPTERMLVGEDGRFVEAVLDGMARSYGYVQSDLQRAVVVRLFDSLCREFVAWLEDQPGQTTVIWLGDFRGIGFERRPDRRVWLLFWPVDSCGKDS